MRKHRRTRHPGSTMMGGLVAVGLAGLIIGAVMALRSTGILDRRVVFGADASLVKHDEAVAKSAALRDATTLPDGTPLEYNGQVCTCSLADASAQGGAASAFVAGAKTRGRLTDQQVWAQLVAPHHGDTAAEPAVAPWSGLATQAVARGLEAIEDVSLTPKRLSAGGGGDDGAPGMVLVAGCGLGRLASAAAASDVGMRASGVACTEQGAEEQAVAEAHIQQSLSGRALLTTRAVLAPGPAAAPRLGLGEGSVELFLAPLEATFREPAAGLAYRAFEACAVLRPGGAGYFEAIDARHIQGLGDGHGAGHSHGKDKAGATRGGPWAAQCDLETAYERFGAGDVTPRGVEPAEVQRLVQAAGCTIHRRVNGKRSLPVVGDLWDVTSFVFSRPAEA